ncbi:WSC domain-containing protein [Mycena sp. CBHHK59/15]|nr:WSC domain-containing protein [Mycena sp. CBHHK59/15]
MFPYRLVTVFILAQLASAADAQSQAATTVLGYKEWKSIGCRGDSTSGRALKHLVAVASRSMTVESCLDACAVDEYALGGVEYGDECYCGNALLYAYGTSEACNKPCSGNTSEICGGPHALNVYQYADTPFTTGPASSLGSYKRWDLWGCLEELFPFGPRLLPHRPIVPIPAEKMTVERCLDGCQAAGYNAAGLEYGQECFCDSIDDGAQEAPSGWESTSNFECNYPCLANATEICGGSIMEGGIARARLTAYVTCAFYGTC